MTIAIGQRIPAVTLVKVTADGPDSIDSTEFFAGRTVVLFAVPGAFTPTCSARHLPSFLDNLDALQAKGVALETYDMPGVSWDDGVADMGGMGKAAWFKDSEGNTLCIDSGFPEG